MQSDSVARNPLGNVLRHAQTQWAAASTDPQRQEIASWALDGLLAAFSPLLQTDLHNEQARPYFRSQYVPPEFTPAQRTALNKAVCAVRACYCDDRSLTPLLRGIQDLILSAQRTGEDALSWNKLQTCLAGGWQHGMPRVFDSKTSGHDSAQKELYKLLFDFRDRGARDRYLDTVVSESLSPPGLGKLVLEFLDGEEAWIDRNRPLAARMVAIDLERIPESVRWADDESLVAIKT